MSWRLSVRSNSARHVPGRVLGISSDLEFNNVPWLLLRGGWLLLLRHPRAPALASTSLLHLVQYIPLLGLFSGLELPLHLFLLLQNKCLFLLGDLTIFILNSALWAGSEALWGITDVLIASRPERSVMVQSDPLPFDLPVLPSFLYVFSIFFFLFISIPKSIIQSFIIFKKSVAVI